MGNCQKSFGITIRLLRLSRKLKQEQLAEKSGLSLRHIKSIERGLSDPTLSTLEKIASALSLRVKVGKLQRERATSILCLQQDSFVQVQVGYLATKTGRQIALSARLLSYGAKGRIDCEVIYLFLFE